MGANICDQCCRTLGTHGQEDANLVKLEPVNTEVIQTQEQPDQKDLIDVSGFMFTY
jgi:hypothetical protein